MYCNGEYVVYGIHGACRVLGREKQLVNRKRTEFLVIEPLAQNGSRFYLPIENPTAMAKLKPVLTVQELSQLLESQQIRTDCWIPDDGPRKQAYRDLINNADRLSLLQMLASVYRYRKNQETSGRKFHQCDENFIRDAEKLLSSEISLVMDITTEQARDYLRQHLQ